MAHHYNSPCKQCYRFTVCSEEKRKSRDDYRKVWKENGCLCGMGNHDCFKSPEAHKRDVENAQKSQLAEKRRKE